MRRLHAGPDFTFSEGPEVLDVAQLRADAAHYLDRWVYTAGLLSNVRNENTQLRLACSLAALILSDPAIQAGFKERGPQLEAYAEFVKAVEEILKPESER